MNRVDVKPISINTAYRGGRRFKTKKYIDFEAHSMAIIKKEKLPEGPIGLRLEYGFSNRAQDVDSCIKMSIDVLQKRLGFNDKIIMELYVKKILVPKGEEFWSFEFYTIQYEQQNTESSNSRPRKPRGKGKG
jgi:Holliday junction resolvase RusA-like endonuclease